MKDLIISAFTRYQKTHLKNYIESIERCGFQGDKIMIVYDIDSDTVDYLKSYGWELYKSQLNGHIHMHRLISIYITLKELNRDYRYLITTDVRDVVFQKNPSLYLEENLKKDILVSSENVLYKDESWGTKNILEGYNPLLLDRYKEEVSCNVGVLAGKYESIRDLLLLNYLLSQSGNTQHYTDQSSFNFIIHNKLVKDSIQIEGLETNWALQIGTLDNPKLIGKQTFKIDDYFIVHQYDRVSNINDSINKKYTTPILPEPPKSDNPIGFTYDRWKSIKDYGRFDQKYNEMLKGKRVVVVGPSPSLEGSGKGDWIDDFDVVVRINKAFPVESGVKEDIGSRTDIHYHCLCTDMHCGGPVFYKEMKDADVFVSCPYPKYVAPFYPDVTRFENDNKKWDLGFHVLDTNYFMDIADMLGTRANSGTLTILDLLCYDVKELHITGFTWFRDGWRKSYKDHTKIFGEEEGKKKEEQWLTGEFEGNHVQKPQEDLVREIYLNDDRVFIDDIMKEILEVK